jgi:hypothetical protein
MRRNRELFFFLLFCQSSFQIKAQSSALFNDSIIASVKIRISSDSLQWLYANPLNNNYLKADMVYEDGQFSDTIANVGFRLRGNTSRFSRKKSFKISFNEFAPGRRYQGVKKFNLNGQHNDPTLVREKFFYHVWNKSGMPERRTVFVRLFINGLYMGLYTGLEELDKDWLQRVMDEKSGNLYKCTYPADLAYLGSNQQLYKDIPSSSATGGRAYSLETNELTDDYSGFVQLCARLNDPVTASFPMNIESILDVPLFLKALAIDIACGNWDDYAYNKNNYFLYHHMGSGQFRFITYDADNTFGVDWIGKNWSNRSINTWVNEGQPRPLATKLLEHLPYRERFYNWFDTLNRQIVHPDSCFPWLDWAKNHILTSVETDSFRTLDYGYSIGDFHLGFVGTVDSHTPFGIKPFLQLRHQATTSQLEVLENKQLYPSGPFLAYPNPFENVFIIQDHEQKIEKIEVLDATGRIQNYLIFKESNGRFFSIYPDKKSLKPAWLVVRILTKSGRVFTFPVCSLGNQ